MEYRKISTETLSTVLTVQDKERSQSILTSMPEPQTMLKLQKLNQLQNLLRHVYQEQEQLKRKQLNLQEQLEYKQSKVKYAMSRRQSRVNIGQLDFGEQKQQQQHFELETSFSNLCFQRTKKQQFYSVMPSPRQKSLEATKTNYMRTPNLSPQKKQSRVGLIRKQSQKCFSQVNSITKQPLIQKLGHLKTMRYGYNSIDELWNECPPHKPSYAD